MSVKFTTVPSKRLAESITGSSTEFKLNSIEGWDGNDLAAADFGTRLWAVFRNSAGTLMEIMEIDPATITDAASAIDILARGLKFTGDQSTEVAANKLTWVKGDTIVELGTHVPQLLEETVRKSGNQTLAGIITFSVSPVIPSPTNPTDAANKSYVDAGLQAGGADASSSIKGISKLNVDPYLVLGTTTITIASPAVVTLNSHGLIAGDTVKFTTTGALPTGIVAGTIYYVIAAGLTANAFEISASLAGAAINTSGSQSGVHTLIRVTPFAVSPNDPRYVHYFAETGVANAYVITPNPAVAAYAVGQRYSFKAVNANTTAATLNVNGLGAIAIKKLSATALVANDILAGQIVMVEYDGTNFQMINPVAAVPMLNSFLDTDGTLAANSDSKVPSQKAVKTYVDGKAVKIITQSSTDTGQSSTSDTNENTLVSFTVPAGSLGTANVVRVRVYGTFVNGSGGNTLTLRAKYGGTTIWSQVIAAGAAIGGSYEWEIYLHATGATNSQTGRGKLFYLRNDGTLALTQYSIGTTANAAIDSTADQTFAITTQTPGTGGAQSSISIRHYVAEKVS